VQCRLNLQRPEKAAIPSLQAGGFFLIANPARWAGLVRCGAAHPSEVENLGRAEPLSGRESEVTADTVRWPWGATELTRSTVTRVNMIRREQTGEPASQWRSLDEGSQPAAWDTEARAGAVGVIDDGRSGKGCGHVNAGDLCGKDAEFMARRPEEPCRTEVRAAIGARKPGNAGGAKGGRKANRREEQ